MESESTGEAIKWGLKRGVYLRKVQVVFAQMLGYQQDKNGELVIDEAQAEVVRLIFDLYLSGHSTVSIIEELVKRNIPSPPGKAKWSKKIVQSLLQNEKHAGHVLLGKIYAGEFPNNKQRRARKG